MKLTIELVPSSCFFSNVRSMVSVKIWDALRNECYKLANNKCELCGAVGNGWSTKSFVECHEVWKYDEVARVQKLERLIGLCSDCHSVKHWGFAIIKGKEKQNYKHIVKVNQISFDQAVEIVKEAFETWEKRSKLKWKVDLSYLDNKNIKYKLDR